MAQHLDIDAALKAEQERLTAQKTALETQLSEINARLGRIDRYFSDEQQQRSLPRTPRRQTGVRRGHSEVQNSVRELIYSNAPDGVTTRDLTKALDGVSPQSIQNALIALNEKGDIIRSEGRGGKHRPITIEPNPPAEAEASQ